MARRLSRLARGIVMTPNVCGGRPRLAGHRITVQNLVEWHERGGKSIKDIMEGHDLTRAEILTGLSYYHNYREEIERAIRQDEALIKTIKQEQGTNPALERIERLGLTLDLALALSKYYHEHCEEVDRAINEAGLDESTETPLEKWVKVGLVDKASSPEE